MNLTGALLGQTLPQTSSPRGSLLSLPAHPLTSVPARGLGQASVFFSLSFRLSLVGPVGGAFPGKAPALSEGVHSSHGLPEQRLSGSPARASWASGETPARTARTRAEAELTNGGMGGATGRCGSQPKRCSEKKIKLTVSIQTQSKGWAEAKVLSVSFLCREIIGIYPEMG